MHLYQVYQDKYCQETEKNSHFHSTSQFTAKCPQLYSSRHLSVPALHSKLPRHMLVRDKESNYVEYWLGFRLLLGCTKDI